MLTPIRFSTMLQKVRLEFGVIDNNYRIQHVSVLKIT